MNNPRNEQLLMLCQRDLTDYAASRKKEVDKGRETSELAGLLVQKYGYGMNQVLRHLADAEDSGRIGSVDVDAAVATINPNWGELDKKRAAARVEVSLGEDKPAKNLFLRLTKFDLAMAFILLTLAVFWWSWLISLDKREKAAVANAKSVEKQFDAKYGDANPFRDFQGIPFKAFSSSKINTALSKERGKFSVADGEYINPFINLPMAPTGDSWRGSWLRFENRDRKYDLTSKSLFWTPQLCSSVAMVRVKGDAISVYFNGATVSGNTVTYQDALAFSHIMLEELAKASKDKQKIAASWK